MTVETPPANSQGLLSQDLVVEARRQFEICNACRYCEGLCAVFPALERRNGFDESDVLFLANLCHDCRACYDACPFSSPHEFAVDLPPLMAAIRDQTYEAFAVPNKTGGYLIRSSGARRFVSVFIVGLIFILGSALIGWDGLTQVRTSAGSFYEVVPWSVMTITASGLALIGAIAMTVSAARFWRSTSRTRLEKKATITAAGDVISMRYMRGGGAGCTYPGEDPEHYRYVLHTLVFYGFAGTLASTTSAAIYQELFGLLPPYSILSLPVVLGTLGGIAGAGGAIGLLLMKRRARKSLSSPVMTAMDLDFLVLLLLVNLSGLATLVLRSGAAMGLTLLVHLALVAAFFITLPYGKFVHAIYRSVALTQNATEERPNSRRAAH